MKNFTYKINDNVKFDQLTTITKGTRLFRLNSVCVFKFQFF